MSVLTPLLIVNQLIDGLPHKEHSHFLQHCETVELTFGQVICEAEETMEHIYFPLNSFISLVTTLKGHQPLEMGLIGNEGMLGVTLILGIKTAPMRAIVQGAGSALKINVVRFQKELRHSPQLLKKLNHYLYVLITQLAQTAACTHFHQIEPRLARWLLMSHDRAHADHFHLTHEFLADMLGVRRSGVTVAAGDLQLKKLISYTRGEISILDRKGLEAESCECYTAVVNDYSRLLG